MVRCRDVTWHGEAKRGVRGGVAWCGMALRGVARHGLAWRDAARRDAAWRDKRTVRRTRVNGVRRW